ncbi:hypothetical protein SCUP234_11158 [Seiridium cupressi]
MQLLLVALISRAGLAIASACDSTTITSQDDASDIKACSTITGDVALSTSVTGAISLDGIEEIKGGLRSQASRFCSFSAPQLRSIDQDLTFHELPNAKDISFPQLTSIGGTCDFDSLPSLQTLNISVLGSTGSFHLGSAQNLTSMELQNLHNVTGSHAAVNITSVGLSYVNGFNDTTHLDSFVLQDVPKMKIFSVRTAEIDELQISGSGDLTLTFYTGYYKGVTGPKSIGVLNITGCADFFPFHETTLVNTLDLYQNNFTALELDWLQVKDTISIMDNPNLSDIMFLSSIVVPDVASHGPPNGTEAPQWKELVIVGNPELDSAKIGFGGWEKSFWYWGVRNLSSLVLTGSQLHNAFFDPDDYSGRPLPETDHTYTTAEFTVSSDAIGFNCSYLDTLRSKGLFQGSYTCQGNTIAAGPVPGSAVRRATSMGTLISVLVAVLCGMGI